MVEIRLLPGRGLKVFVCVGWVCSLVEFCCDKIWLDIFYLFFVGWGGGYFFEVFKPLLKGGPAKMSLKNWSRRACVVADEAKLAIVFTYFFLFGPGGLRAPCVLACAMRSLAIVITIVQSFSLSFFLSLHLLLLTHFGETPEAENLFPPIFWHNWKIYAIFFFTK